MQRLDDKKAEIEYPCEWKYKVIGKDRPLIEAAIADVLGDHKHTVSFSKTSSKGSYTSMNVSCTVYHDEHRMEIYQAFKKQAAIQMVL